MRILRRKTKPQSAPASGLRRSPETFFFCEKRTGVSHFRVAAGPDGQLPADHAAGLLAMHCLVRGQSPGDYIVMVEAGKNLLGGITEKAEKLLETGRSVPTPVQLTRREEEVLSGILRSQANKEIAAALHLSERTVKFHVSSLLAKFRVRGRMDLVREVSRACIPVRSAASAEPMPFPTARREEAALPAPQPRFRRAARSAAVVPLVKRQMTA